MKLDPEARFEIAFKDHGHFSIECSTPGESAPYCLVYFFGICTGLCGKDHSFTYCGDIKCNDYLVCQLGDVSASCIAYKLYGCTHAA